MARGDASEVYAGNGAVVTGNKYGLVARYGAVARGGLPDAGFAPPYPNADVSQQTDATLFASFQGQVEAGLGSCSRHGITISPRSTELHARSRFAGADDHGRVQLVGYLVGAGPRTRPDRMAAAPSTALRISPRLVPASPANSAVSEWPVETSAA